MKRNMTEILSKNPTLNVQSSKPLKKEEMNEKPFLFFSQFLSDQKNSRLFSKTVIAVSFLQNIGLTLQNSMALMNTSKKRPIIYIISQIANTMTISFWIKILHIWPFYPYLRLFLAGIILIFFIILTILFLKITKKKFQKKIRFKQKIKALNFLKLIHTLLVPILIQYFLEILLPGIICEEYFSSIYQKKNFKNEFLYNCTNKFGYLHILIISLFPILAALCLIYTGFIAYLGFDESKTSKNKLGRRNNQLGFWIMFGKVFLVLWRIFSIPSKFMFGVYFVSYFIISLHEVFLAIEHVFFDFEMYIFFLSFFFFEKGAFMSLGILNMMDYRFFGYNLAVVVLIFVLIFVGKLSGNLAQWVAIGFKDNNNSRDHIKLIALCNYISFYEKKIIGFPRLIKEKMFVKSDKIFEFFNNLVGIVNQHLIDCKNVNCFCQKLDNLSNPSENKRVDLRENRDKIIFNSTFLKHFVKQLLTSAISFSPFNINLRFALIDHLFRNMKHFHLTIFHLSIVKKYSKGLQKKYKIFKIKKNLEKEIYRENRNFENKPNMSYFDIESISNLEKNFFRLKKNVVIYFEKFMEFLDLMLTMVKTDLNKVENCHKELLEIEKKIEENYSLVKNNPRSMKLYTKFKRDIKDDQEISEEIEKSLGKKLEKIKLFKAEGKIFYDINLMFDEDTAIISIGALKENMGMILQTNLGAEKLTGYSTIRLLAMNIRELMPTPIKIIHQTFLEGIYETGITKIMYTERKTFLKQRNGYLLPALILVKPIFYSVGCDLAYISYLQTLNTDFEYIMTDRFGKIVGMTRKFTDYFGWLPRDFEKNEIYIQCLIPSLYEFFASIKMVDICGGKLNYKNMFRKIHIKKLLNGFFKDECFNNKNSYHPFPEGLEDIIITKVRGTKRRELNDKFDECKNDIERTCHNLIDKYHVEFIIEEMKVGKFESVLVFKVKSCVSLNETYYRPIRSYFCKKFCRLIIFYMKFLRLLKKVRKRKKMNKMQKLENMIQGKRGYNEEVKALAMGVNRALFNKEKMLEKRNFELLREEKEELLEKEEMMKSKKDDEFEKDEYEKRKMLKELQEGSVNSAGSARTSNSRINVRNSIYSIFFPKSFKSLKFFVAFFILISFVGTQLLLINQSLYYKKLKSMLKSQELLFSYERGVQKIVYLDMNLFLLENSEDYAPNVKKGREELRMRIEKEIKKLLENLQMLRNHKNFLDQKFNGESLNTHLTNKNLVEVENNKNNFQTNFLLLSAQIIKNSYEVIQKSQEEEGNNKRFSEIFSNFHRVSLTITENLKIDPYHSFITNLNFVSTLIITSLILSVLNGIAIVKSYYDSLKYLDRVFSLVATVPLFSLNSLRSDILDRDREKNEKKRKGSFMFFNSKNFSKNLIYIHKPILKFSMVILMCVIILSSFYLLSLFALGFFGGTVQNLLDLNRKVFEIQKNLYELNFEFQNYVFRQHNELERADFTEVEKRLKSIRKEFYFIDKKIFSVERKRLKKYLTEVELETLCNRARGETFLDVKCETVRNGVLSQGRKLIFFLNFLIIFLGLSISSISLLNDFERLVHDSIKAPLKNKILIKNEVEATSIVLFLESSTKEIEKILTRELNLVLTSISRNALKVNMVLVVVLSTLMTFLWKVFVNKFRKRIVESKKVISLYPKKMIIANGKMKRFLNETCRTVVIN